MRVLDKWPRTLPAWTGIRKSENLLQMGESGLEISDAKAGGFFVDAQRKQWISNLGPSRARLDENLRYYQ